MASYADIYTAAVAVEWRSRVTVATLGAAIAIAGEAQGGYTEPQWNARRQYAQLVLSRGGAAEEMSVAILGQLDVADHWAATDQQIYNTVAGIWNAYAGA